MDIKKYLPAIFIAIAALLWGSDAVVRYPTSGNLDHNLIVLVEHIIGLLFILPWVMLRYRKQIFQIQKRDFGHLGVIGIGGALAGIYYTNSIQMIGPSSATLIQMLQPFLVIVAAMYFLKEKVGGYFLSWATWVILNAILISFPDFNFGFISQDISNNSIGVIYALAAMTLWGSCTISGKALLQRNAPIVLVFWRWTIAVVFLAIYVAYQGTAIDLAKITSFSMLSALLIMGAVVGVLAMSFYYYGLKQIPASIATFFELLYPITGIIINTIYFDHSLSAVSSFGCVMLFISIWFLIFPEYKVEQPKPILSR